MDAVDYFLEKADALFVPVVAGMVLVSFASWLFWKGYNSHVFRIKMLDRQRESQQPRASAGLATLRLQAYERIVLFIERIRPQGMLLRLHQPGVSADVLEQLILAAIREEYQHNVTQQLYVSEESWAMVVRLKETTQTLVRQAAAALPPDATGRALGEQLIRHVASLEENPYDIALRLIRKHANG